MRQVIGMALVPEPGFIERILLDRVGDDPCHLAGEGKLHRLIDRGNHLGCGSGRDDAGLGMLRQRPVQDGEGGGEHTGGRCGPRDPPYGKAWVAGLPVVCVAQQEKGAGGIMAQCMPGGGRDFGRDACRLA